MPKLKYTTEESIEMCKKSKHGKDVLYDKYKYMGSHQPSIFICPKHGEFKMTPHNFLKGKGCRLCGYEANALKKRSNFNEIVKRCEKIFCNKYKYIEIFSKNKRAYIKYICPIHGEQEQLLTNHLQGKGCKLCGNEIRNEKNKIDKKTAINNLNKKMVIEIF